MTTPSIAIVGAGATGGYLAARLTRAGLDVTLLARARTRAQLRREPMTITEADGSRWSTRIRTCGAEEITEPRQLVLLCVKTYDTERVLSPLATLLGEQGRVLCLQNGVRGEQVLAEAFGAERVLSGVLYIGSHRSDPTSIDCTAPARVILAGLDGGSAAAARQAHQALTRAGIDCTEEPQIMRATWQKFLFNCALNPATALTGQRLGQLLARPETAQLVEDLAAEAVEVARRAGAPVAADALSRTMDTAAGMDISSSMAADLQAGRRMELDAFSGHVLALARKHQVPAPVTRTVHAILSTWQPDRDQPGAEVTSAGTDRPGLRP